MCYSAQIKADYKKYTRIFGEVMTVREFFETFWRRNEGEGIVIPKAMEATFLEPQTDDERAIKALIDEFAAKASTRFEKEVFEQRTRLVEAERKLAVKETKAAAESQRIATNKIERALARLADLRRTELRDSDSRIYPGSYAPVVVMEDGRYVGSQCAISVGWRASLPFTT